MSERLAVSKKGAQNFDVVKFYLRNIKESEVTKQYQIKVSNRSEVLGT
jgi:hypothetical protein